MNELISILKENIQNYGEQPLTNTRLLTMLKAAQRNEKWKREKEQRSQEMLSFEFEDNYNG